MNEQEKREYDVILANFFEKMEKATIAIKAEAPPNDTAEQSKKSQTAIDQLEAAIKQVREFKRRHGI